MDCVTAYFSVRSINGILFELIKVIENIIYRKEKIFRRNTSFQPQTQIEMHTNK